MSLERARGCLIGLACGDALGAPVEFLPPPSWRMRHELPLEMTGGGRFEWGPGETTDDTAMARHLAESLAALGRYDQADVLARYVSWSRANPKGIGNTIEAVLEAVADGLAVEDATLRQHTASDGKSAGNGSIMRIAPLAIRYRNWPTDLADHARAESRLTHHDQLAADACAFYCRLLACLLRGENPDDQLDVPRQLTDAYRATEDDCARAAEDAPGFVLTALAITCCALRETDGFEEGVRWAISLGYDTDTNAAVAGAALGARDGMSTIPARWRDALQSGSALVGLADALFAQGR